jgi:hypothetical protein
MFAAYQAMTRRYTVSAVPWTQDPQITWGKVLWLLGVVAAGWVIWLAASHLGPGLRAAHRQGTVGSWIANEQVKDGWFGEFDSTSGTVTRPHIRYAGSLPAVVKVGTAVPALDTGASDEVYPLTGSGLWIHDVIWIIIGALALIGLLARGFFVERRRRRATRADSLAQGAGPLP